MCILTDLWTQSLLERMAHVKQKGTLKGKYSLADFEQVQKKITETMLMEIPPEL